MHISLLGKGSETLLSDFDSAGVKYICHTPSVGVVMNAGDAIQLLTNISGMIPWASIAAVLIAWLKYRPSRRITVTSKDNTIVNIEGLNVKEVEFILPLCKNIIAIETKKPDDK